MKLLPFRQYIMLSNLDKREVIAHLSRNLQSHQKVEIGDTTPPNRIKQFEGFVLGDIFSISPMELKGIFFKPVLEGFFRGNERYTAIELSMVFPLGVAAAISFFSSLLGLLAAYFILDTSQAIIIDFLIFFIPMLSLGVLYLSCYLIFRRYCRKTKAFFQEVYHIDKLYERI